MTRLNRQFITCMASSYRVQFHIGHASQQRRLVQQGLAFEAPLPEPPGAAVLRIGLAGDGLVDTAHEPADGDQALPPDFRLLRKLCPLGFVQRST